MKAKIKYLKYQRNGVHGEPFYHCLIELTDDKKRTMLATFRAEDNDCYILRETCRVVDINDLSEAWRGDEISYAIQAEFDKLRHKNGGSIYDCCTKQDLYTV